MRASRLVELLLLLQTRGRTTAAVLARELEVSERTIHRDVDALSAAGVPIYAERGPHGGIQLVDGYRTRLTGLTGDEAEALFMSGIPGPAAELGLGTVVAAARLKVLAALPSELRTRASRIVERFHLDAAGWFKDADAVPLLADLAAAVWESRRIRITYPRREGDVVRTIDPLGLVLKGGAWYLVAAIGGEPRTYRARRIRRIEQTDETFDRPADFDLASYWTASTTAYERDQPRVTVVLRIRHEAIGHLVDLVGERAVDEGEWLPSPEVTPSDDGWRTLRITIDWPDEVPGRIVALGGSAEVLEPEWIRDRVYELARATLERYATPVS